MGHFITQDPINSKSITYPSMVDKDFIRPKLKYKHRYTNIATQASQKG